MHRVCGLSHAKMRMQTIAMDDADFQNWIDEQMVPQARRRRTPTTVRVAPRHSSTARRATWSRVSMAMRTSPLPWSHGPRRTHPLRQPHDLRRRHPQHLHRGWRVEPRRHLAVAATPVVKENYANGLPVNCGHAQSGSVRTNDWRSRRYLETLGQKPSAESWRRRRWSGHGDHRRASCPHQW